MANEIFTRIQLKYDSYSAWDAVKATFKPLKGEICVVNPGTQLSDGSTIPCLLKVGDGTNFFKDLPWISAPAADVYSWAKAKTVELDGQILKFHNGDKTKPVYTVDLSVFVTGDELNTILTNYYTKEEVNAEFTKLRGEIQDLDVGDLATRVGNLETATETTLPGQIQAVDAKFANYYTKDEANSAFTTPSEVETVVDEALAKVSGTDTITGITTLVEYVNTHGADLAAITKEIYGDSGKVGDDPSRIDTAIADSTKAKGDAAAAVSTANTASTVAGEAKTAASEAVGTANSAKEIAETSQTSAKNYAEEAGRQAGVAAGHANTATEKASVASAAAEAAAGSVSIASTFAQTAAAKAGEAESARAGAVSAQEAAEDAQGEAINAQLAAEAAQGKAKSAQSKAEAAQGKAEAAQSAAESAKAAAATAQGLAEEARDAAIEAKNAALDSNTSATAIANAAKNTADAAKTASEEATAAVNGLHAIATSGSIYDVEEGSHANTGSDKATHPKYLIFNCGSATEVL